MKPAWQRLTVLCGLAGPAVVVVGVVIAALGYHGRQSEPFSPLNHFISELGEVGISSRAGVFNACLVVGGLAMAGFMVGLGFYLRSKLGAAAAALGVVAALACSAVGLTPMDDLIPHLKVAAWFFRGGLAAMVLFTALVIIDRRRLLSRWLVVPGILSIASFLLLLSMPTILGKPLLELLDPQRGNRPPVWLLPIVEWSVFFSVVAWIVWASIDLAKRGEKNEKHRVENR